MRKIIAYIATSADGYIARRNGGIEWLDRPRIAGNYGIGAFYRSIDTVVMGRKTYATGVKLGQTHYAGKKNYILSRRRRAGPAGPVEFVRGPIRSFCERLRQAKGKGIWLVGGAETIGAFLDAGEVDEFVIHVIPTLIGDGIPLLQPRHRTVPLSLVSVRRFSDGVVQLHYAVGGRESGTRPTAGRERRR